MKSETLKKLFLRHFFRSVKINTLALCSFLTLQKRTKKGDFFKGIFSPFHFEKPSIKNRRIAPLAEFPVFVDIFWLKKNLNALH
ncbi:MAG: hypothetical protein RIC95_11235 [Vicingaceae bacterium]